MKTNFFKAKRIDNGKWVYGYYVSDPEDGHLIIGYSAEITESETNTIEPVRHEYQVMEETVCEFVRQDTMHGKTTDFYNGDIVMLEMPYRAELLKAEIYYDNSSCAFRAKVHMDGGFYIHWLSVLTVNSVIGNIFDNADFVSF